MEVGLFLIHAVIGLLIAAHGAQKLFGWFGGGSVEETGGMMESLGLVPGRQMALAAGVAEFGGGLLLALGLLVPAAAVLIASTYLVAARTAHAGKGPWNSNGGWEYVLVLSTVAIGLAFNGAGKWSLDHAIGWDVSGLWWGIGAAVVALIGAIAVLAITRRMSSAARAPLGDADPVAGDHPL
jgi:putative oxidoreductase